MKKNTKTENLISNRVKNIEVSAIRQLPIIASKLTNVISLGQGIPDLKTPEYIRNGVIDLLKNSNEVGKYSLQPGLPELKNIIAKNLSKVSGWKIDKDKEICITAGAMEALAIVISAIVEIGNEVLVFDPGYPSYNEQIIFAGGTPVSVPLKEEWGLDILKLEKSITKKTKAIIVCNPSNPTGILWGQDDLAKIVSLAKKYNILIIADQTYEFLVYDNKVPPSFLKYRSIKNQLIICSGFSKEFAMTGWRVGYLFAPAQILEQAAKIHDAFVICAPTISQYAALIGLTKKPKNSKENIKADLTKKREVICKRLDALSDLFSYKKPQGAYYILARYKKTKLNSWDFTLKLLNEAKVIVIPGSAFGSLGEGHIRFSFGASIKQLNEAFDRIEKWNKSLK